MLHMTAGFRWNQWAFGVSNLHDIGFSSFHELAVGPLRVLIYRVA